VTTSLGASGCGKFEFGKEMSGRLIREREITVQMKGDSFVGRFFADSKNNIEWRQELPERRQSSDFFAGNMS
jgi:hypothetical protein